MQSISTGCRWLFLLQRALDVDVKRLAERKSAWAHWVEKCFWESFGVVLALKWPQAAVTLDQTSFLRPLKTAMSLSANGFLREAAEDDNCSRQTGQVLTLASQSEQMGWPLEQHKTFLGLVISSKQIGQLISKLSGSASSSSSADLGAKQRSSICLSNDISVSISLVFSSMWIQLSGSWAVWRWIVSMSLRYLSRRWILIKASESWDEVWLVAEFDDGEIGWKSTGKEAVKRLVFRGGGGGGGGGCDGGLRGDFFILAVNSL